MKRWEYNTLRGEILVFAFFISIIIFELLGTFYIFFLADGWCRQIAQDAGCPSLAVLFAWVSRVVVAFYMWLVGWLFHRFAEKQGPL